MNDCKEWYAFFSWMSVRSEVRIFTNEYEELCAYFYEWVCGVVCVFSLNEFIELCAYFHEWVWGVVCIFLWINVLSGVRVFMNECNELSAYIHEWVCRMVCVFFMNECAEWSAYFYEWVWGLVCVFSWMSVRWGVRIVHEWVCVEWMSVYMWSVYPSNRRMRLVSGGRNWKSTKSTGIARWFTIGRDQREVKKDRWKTQLKLKTVDASIDVYVVLVKSCMLYFYPRLKLGDFW